MPNCVNCGAPVRPDPGNGALVCHHCGSVDQQPEILRRIEVGAETAQVCPACATLLSEAALDDVPLLVCRRCYGMLIDMEHFVAIVETARAHARRADTVLPRRQKPGERILACPGCGRPMLSHLYGGPGNLVLDTCERCHMNWLDPGELRRIARAP